MELDELKTAWNQINLRLDQLEGSRLDFRASRERSAFTRVKLEATVELAAGMATMFAMGNLIGDHISAIATTPTLALPAVLVDLLALVTIILASRQLHMIATLDYSKPTSEALRLVAALRNLRARSTQYLFLICLPLWSVFPIVLGQALFGFNFIRSVNWPWLISNVMFGIAVAIALAVAARKLADRSEVLERIDDAIAGAGLARARELLLQVKTLESEA